MSTEIPRIRVDANAAVPLATQVSQQLAWLIASGKLRPGDQLPPIRQLAAQLGINLHTVRAAYSELAAEGLVSTRRGRLATVLGYDRTRAASGAPDLPSFTIGAIIPGFSSFYAPMLDGIEEASAEHPALLFICNAREDPEAALTYVDRLIARRVDGIIIASPLLPANAPIAAPGHGPHIVFIDCPGAPGPSVEFDLQGSSLQATNHLIEHGHHRIGYVTPPVEWPNVAPKYAGFQRAIREAGLSLDPRLVASVPDFRLEAGYHGANRLLDQSDPPTGIVAANDDLALGAMHAIASRGLNIPDDVALVGNDDIDMARVVRPALSTVALPAREAGIQAASILQQLIAGQTPEPLRLILDCQLVARETCGCSGTTRLFGPTNQHQTEPGST